MNVAIGEWKNLCAVKKKVGAWIARERERKNINKKSLCVVENTRVLNDAGVGAASLSTYYQYTRI